MNVAELERKLFTHTESEEWHLKHPGKLSARYQTIQQVEKMVRSCIGSLLKMY